MNFSPVCPGYADQEIVRLLKEFRWQLKTFGQISVAECRMHCGRKFTQDQCGIGWKNPCNIKLELVKVNKYGRRWMLKFPKPVEIGLITNVEEPSKITISKLQYEHSATPENIISTDPITITNIVEAAMPHIHDQEMKKDSGKPRLALVPPSLIQSVGAILTFGAEKYEPHGWKRVAKERYKDAMVRHLCAYLGEENSIDEESGLPHLWHMTCNAAFLIDFAYQEQKQQKTDALIAMKKEKSK